MIGSNLKFLLEQLAYQSPTFLVYLVGVLLAILFMSQHPRASLLTLLGCGLLLITALAGIGVQSYLVHQRTEGTMPVHQFAQFSMALGICTSIVRAVGLALVLAAVFVGRGRTGNVRV